MDGYVIQGVTHGGDYVIQDVTPGGLCDLRCDTWRTM